MADIELVIKLSEDVYKACQRRVDNPKMMVNEVDIAIANGTPLPKGHDRLVESNAVVKALFNHKTIYDVPTIIEADEEYSRKIPRE